MTTQTDVNDLLRRVLDRVAFLIPVNAPNDPTFLEAHAYLDGLDSQGQEPDPLSCGHIDHTPLYSRLSSLEARMTAMEKKPPAYDWLVEDINRIEARVERTEKVLRRVILEALHLHQEGIFPLANSLIADLAHPGTDTEENNG